MRFTLRTILFWVIPYCGICFVLLTALREPMMSPGEGIPMFHWARLVTLSVVTLVWIALLREDRRALRRQMEDRRRIGETKI